MQRKPGGYRQPTEEQRRLSKLTKKEYADWFRQFWTMTGASTRQHPAPFPLELATRLVRMFSFAGDTVLDPFCGTGTTMLAALNTGRNSIGIDIDPEYCRMALRRLDSESGPLFAQASIEYHTAADITNVTQAAAVADAPARKPARRRRTLADA